MAWERLSWLNSPFWELLSTDCESNLNIFLLVSKVLTVVLRHRSVAALKIAALGLFISSGDLDCRRCQPTGVKDIPLLPKKPSKRAAWWRTPDVYCHWEFPGRLRGVEMSAHIRTPYSLLSKFLEFLNNKYLQQKGRSVTQFEHCRHLPFKGKKCKSEHDRSRDREKVRLSQAPGRNVERIITAVDGNSATVTHANMSKEKAEKTGIVVRN